MKKIVILFLLFAELSITAMENQMPQNNQNSSITVNELKHILHIPHHKIPGFIDSHTLKYTIHKELADKGNQKSSYQLGKFRKKKKNPKNPYIKKVKRNLFN